MRREACLRLVAAALVALALAACTNTGSGNVKQESKEDEKTEAARIHTELGQKYMQQGNLKVALEDL